MVFYLGVPLLLIDSGVPGLCGHTVTEELDVECLKQQVLRSQKTKNAKGEQIGELDG
jgi:hypothetical protein